MWLYYCVKVRGGGVSYLFFLYQMFDSLSVFLWCHVFNSYKLRSHEGIIVHLDASLFATYPSKWEIDKKVLKNYFGAILSLGIYDKGKNGLHLFINVLERKVSKKIAIFSWKMTLIAYRYSVSDKKTKTTYEAWSRNLNGIILFQIHTS